jgi:hypothetical protein
MSCCAVTFAVGETNILWWRGLQNIISSVYDDDATVTVTIYDSAGDELVGTVWPIYFAYVADSDGDYYATIPADIGLEKGKRYKAIIDAVGSGGEVGYREVSITAQLRGCE